MLADGGITYRWLWDEGDRILALLKSVGVSSRAGSASSESEQRGAQPNRNEVDVDGVLWIYSGRYSHFTTDPLMYGPFCPIHKSTLAFRRQISSSPGNVEARNVQDNDLPNGYSGELVCEDDGKTFTLQRTVKESRGASVRIMKG